MGWRALPTASQNRMGLTRAGMEGGGRVLHGCSGRLGTCFKGAQKGLTTPLGAFRCKTAMGVGLGAFSLSRA